MKGIQNVRVSNRKTDYRFELYRNITVVRGDSGTGKTTLYDMINAYTRNGTQSGVQIASSKPCVALEDIDWKNQLRNTSNSIIFIDEGAKFAASEEFAHEIKQTDNYYVFFIREDLHQLPYSVDEIYEIKTSRKYHTFSRIYQKNEVNIYSLTPVNAVINYDTLLTEDSKAGYTFYKHYLSDSGKICVSANGKSSIYRWLLEHRNDKVCVIADGAAFGAEMDKIMQLQQKYPENITICLPESFEWMILKSGLIKDNEVFDVLAEPSRNIESKEFFSWEQFFTHFLIHKTKDTYMAYSKSELNTYYTVHENAEKIAAVIVLRK
ncbi:MAG: hypothetical protein IJI57_01265 [Flexilinea sp.]|nr:hypothetical protein [Flexilinea sp.]